MVPFARSPRRSNLGFFTTRSLRDARESFLLLFMILDSAFYVYIMSNKRQTVLYTGKTSDLQKRVIEHKLKLSPKSFTARYNVNQLVYFEGFSTNEEATQREYQIKAGSRQKKIDLINSMNPQWLVLSSGWDLY